MHESHKLFCLEFESILTKWQPNLIALERFQPRPNLVTKTVESVSMMLGTVITLVGKDFPDVTPTIFPASEWKNAVRRSGLDLDEVYDWAAYHGYKPHTVDSIGIGLHAGCQSSTFPNVVFISILKRLFRRGSKQLTDN